MSVILIMTHILPICYTTITCALVFVRGSVCEEPRCPRYNNDVIRELQKIGSDMGSIRQGVERIGETMKEVQSNWSRTAPPHHDNANSVETDGWELVFRATAGNGDNVYDAWTSGKAVTYAKPMNMERSLSNHYRSSKINNWSSHMIKYVKYVLYENGREVAFIMFDGTGSTQSSWFDRTRLINSSWPDLTSTNTYNHFSINGHLDSRIDRRFFINNIYYGGCNLDKGHIVTLDTTIVGPCDFDKQPTFPQFLYSKITSADHWNTRMFGRADYLAVFMKTCT